MLESSLFFTLFTQHCFYGLFSFLFVLPLLFLMDANYFTTFCIPIPLMIDTQIAPTFSFHKQHC